MRRLALISLLILAGCTSAGETTTSVTTAAPLTTLPEAGPATTATAATTSTTTAAPTTTTTTTTLPPNAAPAFSLTQVVFGEAASVVITNWGNAGGNIDSYWLAQSDSYQALPAIELGPGEQALIGIARTAPPDLAGFAAIVFLGPSIGDLDPDTGEVVLYQGTAFDDPESIVAYVAWGEGEHPTSTAAMAAGLWAEGSVAVFDDAPSISSGVFPAVSSSDWAADVGG
jgi:hypothetical protein